MSVETMNAVSPAEDHLITGHDAQWAFWRWIGLRGAGFPAKGVCRLRAPESTIKAVELALKQEEETEACRLAAVAQINSALDELRSRQEWDDKSKRIPLLRARENLKQGRLENIPPAPLEFPLITQYRAALHLCRQAKERFQQEFSASVAQQSMMIRDVAASPRFREAVTWQNRSAVQTAIIPLIQANGRQKARDSHQRQHEELVANYFQRYSVKNDTIGFFGPVGWARAVPEGARIEVIPGAHLVTHRKVYFESWAIEKLAAAITQDARIYPFIAPILMPFVRLEGQSLLHPLFRAIPLSAMEAAILARCDGFTTAKQIAQDLGPSFGNAGDIYQRLAELAGKRLIYWDLIVALGAYPERMLQQDLERIEDDDVRIKALSLLQQLETARQQVQASVGDVEKLDGALENLDRTFLRITGAQPTRCHGRTYGARTLVYEDCRRDAEVLVGPDLVQAIATPMSLLLTSARWLTSEVAGVYKAKFKETYLKLTDGRGKGPVDVPSFWIEAVPYLLGDQSTFIGPVQKEFQKKWDRILGLSSLTRPVQYSVEELQQAVRAEFPASRAGWRHARYHSPDLMIAASSPEAIRRGEYMLVLGELHVAMNSLSSSLFVNQHPFPAELMQAVERDMGSSSVTPVYPKEFKLVSRTLDSLIAPDDWLLEVSDSFAGDRSKALPISTLVIEDQDGELIAKSRDGRLCCNVVELVGGFREMVCDAFKFVASRPHSPRVIIDRLIIIRESWRFRAEELGFAAEENAAERFLRSKEWARKNGLPNCLFFKAPVEPKPVYLDFDSPILMDIFSRMVRSTLAANGPQAVIEMTEMLPGIEEAWLPDSKGNRYTCEFRIVAVDQCR